MLLQSLSLRSLLVLLAFTSSSLAAPKWKDWDGRPTVDIETGPLVGVATTAPNSTVRINRFLGVPFAAKVKRFQPAKPAANWTSPYDASNYKTACIQQFNYPEASRNLSMSWFNSPPPPAGEGEDCLNLNIWAPATYAEGKAVMVWIHGGSLRIGSGSLTWYDGASIAANQDVIVVTINYRIGLWGFPGSSELPVSGNNLGFLDQRFALEWVQRNIAAFGGDPGRVTIVGESAGSGTAILESGTYSYNAPPAAPYRSFGSLAALANCTGPSNLTCLSTIPALTLKSLIEHNGVAFAPIIDNGTYAAYPTYNRKTGNFARVPVLGGTNNNEGNIFVLAYNTTAAYLNATFPGVPKNFTDAILAAYPIPSADIRNEYERTSKIATEFTFGCPEARHANDTLTAGAPSWRYYFNATFANSLLPTLGRAAGVYHASEIRLIFETYPTVNATAFQKKLSEFMQDTWGKFMRHPAGGPGWGMIPDLGVLGGGVRLDEVTEGKLLEVVDQKVVDGRCKLFELAYQVRG